MRKPADLSIGQRLALGFGAAVAFLIVLVVLASSWLQHIEVMRLRLAESIEPRAEAAIRLETAILNRGLTLRSYMARPDARGLAGDEAAARETREIMARLQTLPKEAHGLAAFTPIPGLLERHEEAAAALTAAVRANPLSPEVAKAELRLTETRTRLLEPVREFSELQSRQREQARTEITTAQRRTQAALAILSLLVIVVVAATGLITGNAVRKPAASLVTTARQLETGDFEPAVRLAEQGGTRRRFRNELSELSRAFGRMAVGLRDRERRLRAGARISAAMASSLEVRRLCADALAEITDYLGVEVGAVYLATPDGDELVREAGFALDGEGVSFRVGEGIPGQAAAAGRALIVRDIPADSPFRVRLGIDQVPPRTVAAVPMMRQNRTAGVVLVAGLRDLDESAAAFLEHSATQLAVSVQNALAHARVQELAEELQRKNEILQAQNEELQAQGEEIQSQNEERYRQLFTHVSEGFALFEEIKPAGDNAPELRWLDVNPAFEALVGIRRERVIGRLTRETETGLESGWIDRGAEAVRAGGAASRFEAHSEVLDKHFEVVSFRPRAGEMAALLFDVTDRRQAEETLRETDRRKTEFLAMLSHELRNPLAPIRNSLAVLERSEAGSERALRAREVIVRQVDHLVRLVDDLLDITRISRGKIRLRRGRLDLAAVVRQSVEDNQPLFADAGVDLESEIPDGPVVVHGDEVRLTQVVGNLLQNAAKFTPRGGRVRLRLEQPPGGGDVVIAVSDTGIGMSREVMQRLFQPFAQADDSLARLQGGLGLGLALVKSFVDLHGGRVDASSDGPGQGSEFVVTLPQDGSGPEAPPRSVGPSRPMPPEAPSPEPRRVLIIEDQKDAASSLKELLTLLGYRAEAAESGREGLAMARTFQPEIVLCDIGLPDMDGYQVVKELRSEQVTAGAYLVALTGYALPEDRRRALDAGYHEHLAKPADIDQIRAVLSKAAEGGGRRE